MIHACAVCNCPTRHFLPVTWNVRGVLVTEYACLMCSVWDWPKQKAHGMRIA